MTTKRPSIHKQRGIDWRQRIDNIASDLAALQNKSQSALNDIDKVIETHRQTYPCADGSADGRTFALGIKRDISASYIINPESEKHLLRICSTLAQLAILIDHDSESNDFNALLEEVEALANGTPSTARMNAATEVVCRQQPQQLDLSAIQITIPSPPPNKKCCCCIPTYFNTTVQDSI